MVNRKTSLTQAKRIYECPLVFVAPEEANICWKKPYKPTGKLRKPDARPKRQNELSLKQHESLQKLLNIYAEQSSKNYRVSATHVGSLPKLVTSANNRKKTVIEIGRTSQMLPKIVAEATARNKRQSSKTNDIHFPSILE